MKIAFSEKISPQLSAALLSTPYELGKEGGLSSGYLPESDSWEVIVKYVGDIEKIKEKVMTTIIEPFNAIAANIGVMEVIKYFTNYADCKVINKSLLLNLVDMTIELLNYNNISEGE